MNDKITTFLNSDLLEKYLIGQTTSVETETVESYISKYPEVEQAYNTMQNQLELVAQSQAVEAPNAILNSILNTLDEETPVIPLNKPRTRKKWFQLSIAASVIAIMFASTTYIFFQQNQLLKIENQKIADEIYDRLDDLDQKNMRLDEIMRQMNQLNNPETEKYIINGNNRAKNLKTVAYINPREKTSMLDVVSLPQLPEEQCYQIWAELEDKMVNLGILNEGDRQLKSIPYTEDALALSITIEQRGSKLSATKENSVAEITLNK
ncbi:MULTISPECIES: anti-sigma factor [Bizionia]|uniref:Anti-sigma factor n=1 Tax=Bizionia algoritergicola TaxID=291187 RepID=A0A5D0QW64_9FLAO|nr:MULTISPECIES: anti-sigma factor [Bizionia]OBX22652.1 RNA polymerase subunit sigma-70 [Bizionia sp. APA-3]TYB72921.1 anti-sigma factor [Bizionia algoritergicola]